MSRRRRKQNRSCSRAAAAVAETPWAILPAKLDEIVALLDARQAGRFSDDEIAARLADVNQPTQAQAPEGSQIAVLNLFGTIFHRANLFTAFSGGTSATVFGREFDAALADPAVQSILINVDSPGGAVPGVQELADKVFQARGTKPITAICNPTCASAALWIASQADELVAIPSATTIGSVGVLTVHTDNSAANAAAGVARTYIQSVAEKNQFNADEPLSEQDIAEAADRVRRIHETFAQHLARGRGMDAAAVDAQFGEGRVFLADDALRIGMIDRIATFDDLLDELGADATESPLTAEARHQPAFACAQPDASRSTPIAELIG